MVYIGLFLLSWLVLGAIGIIPQLFRKDIGKMVNETAQGLNIKQQKNPKLFLFIAGVAFGYFTFVLEIHSQFKNK